VILGEVAVLVNERKAAGTYDVQFDASGLSTGVYLYRLTSGSFMQTRKMILLKYFTWYFLNYLEGAVQCGRRRCVLSWR